LKGPIHKVAFSPKTPQNQWDHFSLWRVFLCLDEREEFAQKLNYIVTLMILKHNNNNFQSLLFGRLSSCFTSPPLTRSYDRQRYLKERKKAKQDTTSLSDVFELFKIYSFERRSTTTTTEEEEEEKNSKLIQVQFQLGMNSINKQLFLTTSLPHFVPVQERKVLVLAVRLPHLMCLVF
jgi:hypothetical protein